MLPSFEDFQVAFKQGYTPAAIGQLVDIVDEAASWAEEWCRQAFPAGNYAATQGMVRRQRIEDRLRTTRFDGDLIAQTMDFDGNVLIGDERISNFTLLWSGEVGIVVCRSSRNHPLPRRSEMRRALTLGSIRDTPLFPEALRRFDLKIGDVKALFVVRYWLDEEVGSGATVDEIEVVVLNEDGKKVHCELYDLRGFAAEAVTTLVPSELPIALRNDVVSHEGSPQLPGERSQDAVLPMSFKNVEKE